MKHLAPLVLLLPAACGRLEVRPTSSPAAAPRRAELEAKAVERENAYKAATQDRAFWPSVTDCDGTVWSGVACLAGVPVRLDLAEYPAGTLNRRPPPACWVPERAGEQQPSRSTASHDDAVLYAACAFHQGDRGALERLLAHAAADGGYIGLPHQVDVTYLRPSLKATIERAVERLGGAKAPAVPIVELPPGKDYQVHIVTEEVAFAVAATGGESGWEEATVAGLAAAAPNDALVAAELGALTHDFHHAEDLLLGDTPIPNYVRGDQPQLFAEAWWLRAARIVLDHTE